MVTGMSVKTQSGHFDFNYGTIGVMAKAGYHGPMHIGAHDNCIVTWIDQNQQHHETSIDLRKSQGLTGGWLFTLTPTNTIVAQRVAD